MDGASFGNLLLVVAAAVVTPLMLGLTPRLSLPAVVLEILAGVAIGPSGLGFAAVDATVAALSLLGLAFLLFLAGAEIRFDTLGPLVWPASLGFLLSLGLGLLAGYVFEALGVIDSPFLLALTLSATALGIVVGVLNQTGQVQTTLGQLVIAGSSVADFGTIILLSLFFSRESASAGVQLLLVTGLGMLSAVVVLMARRAGRWEPLQLVITRLSGAGAEIRIRMALLLLVGFAALAEWLGLEMILGAFLAGGILALIDHDGGETHRVFRQKLDAVGYGVFIPIFLVTSGMRVDLGALVGDTRSLTLIPLLLSALLLVRGLPALLYWRLVGGRNVAAAGLLQATSLAFIVATVQIGTELGLMERSVGAALVTVALLSVLLFPLGALALLTQEGERRRDRFDEGATHGNLA